MSSESSLTSSRTLSLLSTTPALSRGGAYRLVRRVRYRRPVRSWGGPLSVSGYLRLGLDRAGIPYRFNPSRSLDDDVGVLSDVDALRWAIRAKKLGRIKNIVAGPNLMLLPTHHGGVLRDSAIDRILVPAQWVLDLYRHFAPDLAPRLTVWPVGVDEEYWAPAPVDRRKRDVLVYPKSYPPELLEAVLTELRHRRLTVTLLDYGRYSPSEYRDQLRQHRWMLFLSESESQGIALFEAWSSGVPTLVWERRLWQYGPYAWSGASSAPYLSKQAGAIFTGPDDLRSAIDCMQESLFAPREYVLSQWTAAKAARAYAGLFVAG